MPRSIRPASLLGVIFFFAHGPAMPLKNDYHSGNPNGARSEAEQWSQKSTELKPKHETKSDVWVQT